MAHKHYFTAGEMAQLHGISKQTLLFYDKKGVFSPAFVNPQNGYRYYSASQLETLDTILMLKEIGFSLAEICVYLQERNGVGTVVYMEEQKRLLENEIAHKKRIVKRLTKKIETLRTLQEHCDSIEFYTQNHPQYLAVQTVASPRTLFEIDLATKQLLLCCAKEQVGYEYLLGVMVPVSAIENGAYTAAQNAFLPLSERPKDPITFSVHKKSAGTYLRGYHKGTYETIGQTYEKMLSTLKRYGYTPYGCSYEYCVLDSFTSSSADEYVTEIHLPFLQKEHDSSKLC